MKRAFTILELIIAILILITLAWLMVPTCTLGGDGVRFRVSSVKADQRSLATAIESYFIDHKSYPAWSADPERNAFRNLSPKKLAAPQIPTFAMNGASQMAFCTVTTPVSYVTSLFVDPFAPQRGQVYCYWSVSDPADPAASGWILWSPGPDGRYDLTLENVARAYDPNGAIPNEYLINLTYDPTNGSVSPGDVYRTKR